MRSGGGGIHGTPGNEDSASCRFHCSLKVPNPSLPAINRSIRRECLNHFVILNARHLRRALALYFGCYHGSRTHLGLAKQ